MIESIEPGRVLSKNFNFPCFFLITHEAHGDAHSYYETPPPSHTTYIHHSAKSSQIGLMHRPSIPPTIASFLARSRASHYIDLSTPQTQTTIVSFDQIVAPAHRPSTAQRPPCSFPLLAPLSLQPSTTQTSRYRAGMQIAE